MSDRNERALLRLLRHIEHTLEYCDGKTYDDFTSDSMLQEACVFNVMQVGELAGRAFDEAFMEEHPELAWREMRGLRNRIVHDYEGIRMQIIWETITVDFPPLAEKLRGIIEKHPSV